MTESAPGIPGTPGIPGVPGAPRSLRSRIVAISVAAAVLAGVAVAYTLHAAQRAQSADTTSEFGLDRGHLYFRSTEAGAGRVARLPASGKAAPQAARTTGGPSCERFYAAGGTGLCLQRRSGIPPKSYAVVLDDKLREKRRIALTGIPNRARVSASGRMLSWTMFATGDSYAGSSFSTRTSILDTRTGYLIKNMEEIPLTLDGRRYHAPDVNYWGVTFTKDDNVFYATVSTKGKTYLVRGDMKKWAATALRENVECPALSPDDTRLAFKKRVREGTRDPWRLYVLDLRTMRERPLAERRNVDDQAAWLDDGTLAYALPGEDGRKQDIWATPADGSGKPTLRVRGGSSPAAVR
ncbi:TolB family protein [Streptomyces kanamyceticus]|uniref:TolB family protein n=1 Tax=Streptomyces kanamyceticus TaxID=1967 RepID=UPI0037DCA3C9